MQVLITILVCTVCSGVVAWMSLLDHGFTGWMSLQDQCNFCGGANTDLQGGCRFEVCMLPCGCGIIIWVWSHNVGVA